MSGSVFTHPRLAEIEDFLASCRTELLEAAELIPDDRWGERQSEKGWSAGEVLEHLRLVEHGVMRLVAKLVREGAPALPPETATSSVVRESRALGSRDRSVRIEAPPRVSPTVALDRATAIASLAGTRAALLDALRPADGLALGALSWPHQVLGELDLYEWLVFVGAHEQRHAAQLRDMVDATGSR